MNKAAKKAAEVNQHYIKLNNKIEQLLLRNIRWM